MNNFVVIYIIYATFVGTKMFIIAALQEHKLLINFYSLARESSCKTIIDMKILNFNILNIK